MESDPGSGEKTFRAAAAFIASLTNLAAAVLAGSTTFGGYGFRGEERERDEDGRLTAMSRRVVPAPPAPQPQTNRRLAAPRRHARVG